MKFFPLAVFLMLTASVTWAQEADEYEQPGYFFDPTNLQANFDKPLDQLRSDDCRTGRTAEPDRTFKLAGKDWSSRWRFAQDSDIQTAEGLDAIDGYRFLLGTILDYDQDGIEDYARVVMNEDRDSAVLIRFANKDREPVLLASEDGLLSGEAIKGTTDGCLIIAYPEVGAVTYFTKNGQPMATYINHGGEE